MKPSKLERYRSALLTLREQILREGADRLPPARRDPTEVGSDEDEQPLVEMHQVIASNRNQRRDAELKRIDAALARLEASPDDFGLCVECEDEIAPRRLELLPYVELCLDCQAKADAPRGGARRHLTDFEA